MRQEPGFGVASGGGPAASSAGQAARQPTASPAPIRVPRWAYPLVTLASLLIGAEAIVRGTRGVSVAADSDLTNFFFRSADYILRGDPWHMYAVRGSGAYPNFNPPLSTFLMAPLLGLARAVGFARNYGEQITFVSLPFILVVPLLGVLVLRALRHFYPEMPDTQRFLAYVLIVLSPLTWQSFSPWYHLEQPLMLCFLVASLLALASRRPALGGVLAGLAMLTRTTALMPLIAVGVLLLWRREWRALFSYAGVTAVVTALGFAPFIIYDRADVTYSFLSWRGTAPIGGNSVWSIFAAPDGATGLRHTLDALARRLDQPSVVVLILAVAALAALRRRIPATSRDAWAVLAIAALAVPMLSKTVWPYYYLDPFVLLLVWEFTSMHDRISGVWRWPVLSFGYLVVTGTLSQFIGLQSVGALDRIGLGLLEFAAMAAFAAAIWMRLGAAKPVAAVAPAGPAPLAAAAPQVMAQGSPARLAAGTAVDGVRAQSPTAEPLAGRMPWAAGAAPNGEAPPPFRVRPDAPNVPGADHAGRSAAPAGPLPRVGQGSPGATGPRAQSAAAQEQWPDLDGVWPPKPPVMGER